jgi:hypothetical protein
MEQHKLGQLKPGHQSMTGLIMLAGHPTYWTCILVGCFVSFVILLFPNYSVLRGNDLRMSPAIVTPDQQPTLAFSTYGTILRRLTFSTPDDARKYTAYEDSASLPESVRENYVKKGGRIIDFVSSIGKHEHKFVLPLPESLRHKACVDVIVAKTEAEPRGAPLPQSPMLESSGTEEKRLLFWKDRVDQYTFRIGLAKTHLSKWLAWLLSIFAAAATIAVSGILFARSPNTMNPLLLGACVFAGSFIGLSILWMLEAWGVLKGEIMSDDFAGYFWVGWFFSSFFVPGVIVIISRKHAGFRSGNNLDSKT